MNEGEGGGRLVNPRLVKIFGLLTVGDDEFELEDRARVVVYAHDNRISAVCVFGIVAEVGLTLLKAHAVFSRVLHDFVTDGRRNAREKEGETTDAVLSDVEHIPFGQAVEQVGLKEFGEILLALHISEPRIVGRADIKKRRLGEGDGHLVEYEKNHKFLHLAVESAISD